VTPYDELLALVERETELIAAGAWDELATLDGPRIALLACMPKVPPADARPLLELASDQLEKNASALSAAMAQTQGELDRLGRARAKIGSYAQDTRPRFQLLG
jgi:hypothetical protein